ncbi:hypothetical protein D3C77_382970 [compost metagenome]
MIGDRIAMNERRRHTAPKSDKVIGKGLLVWRQQPCAVINSERFPSGRIKHIAICLLHQPDAGRLFRIDFHHPKSLQDRQHIGDVTHAVLTRRQQARSLAQRAGFLRRIGGGNLAGIAGMMLVVDQIAECRFKGSSRNYHLRLRRLARVHNDTLAGHFADLKRRVPCRRSQRAYRVQLRPQRGYCLRG